MNLRPTHIRVATNPYDFEAPGGPGAIAKAGLLLKKKGKVALQGVLKDRSTVRVVIWRDRSQLMADIYFEEPDEEGFNKSESYYVGSARKWTGQAGVIEALAQVGYPNLREVVEL